MPESIAMVRGRRLGEILQALASKRQARNRIFDIVHSANLVRSCQMIAADGSG
jgi:hypothetical protein